MMQSSIFWHGWLRCIEMLNGDDSDELPTVDIALYRCSNNSFMDLKLPAVGTSFVLKYQYHLPSCADLKFSLEKIEMQLKR
jgi:hypothetical protein